MQAYAKPHYLALGLTEDDRIIEDIEKEEDPENTLRDLESLDPEIAERIQEKDRAKAAKTRSMLAEHFKLIEAFFKQYKVLLQHSPMS